jgi:putative membrane protein
MGRFTKFSNEEKERIRLAVEQLEQSTSGELRPVFVRRSDHYMESRWFGACIGALVGIATVVLLSYLWLLPGGLGVHIFFLMLLAMMAVGYLVPVLLPGIGVQLAGHRRVEERVLQRAAEVFLAEEVFNTRDRIGILLMVS